MHVNERVWGKSSTISVGKCLKNLLLIIVYIVVIINKIRLISAFVCVVNCKLMYVMRHGSSKVSQPKFSRIVTCIQLNNKYTVIHPSFTVLINASIQCYKFLCNAMRFICCATGNDSNDCLMLSYAMEFEPKKISYMRF